LKRLLVLAASLAIVSAALAANPQIVQTAAAPGLGNYGYDGSGNIIQAGPRTYLYDRVGRLSSVTNGAVTEQTYTYDRHGNLLKMETTSVSASNVTTTDTTRLGVNAKTNRIDQNSTNGVANNMVATYDSFGNVAWSPTGTFTYDQFHMPKESTVGGLRTLYLYSASDERIASIHPAYAKEFWTIRDPGGRVLRRMDRTAGTWSWSQDYIYGAGRLIASEIPSPAKVLHYHADHLGTPRLITGNGGAQVGSHHYYPFGMEILGGTNDGERLKFTGHERDAATLDYMHARYYDPSMGRFLSVDPYRVSAKPHVPLTWNRYTYAVNNPLRFVDPDGRDVVLAPGLSRTERARVVNALAKASRNAEFKQRLTTADAATMPVPIGTAKLQNDFIVNPYGSSGKIKYGSTTITTNADNTAITKVDVAVDFQNIDFSKNTTVPISDVTVIAHEMDHAQNYLTPEGRLLLRTNPEREEQEAGVFGETVAADPATRARPTAEEKAAIESLLKPKR